jgi:hypothetical protein
VTRIIPRLDLSTGVGIPVVYSDLRTLELRVHPGQELVAITHVRRFLEIEIDRLGHEWGTNPNAVTLDGLNLKRMKGLEPSTFCMATILWACPSSLVAASATASGFRCAFSRAGRDERW